MSAETNFSSNKFQTFWNWFLEHEDRIFHFERDQEPTFDALGQALQDIHPDLTFEFGPVHDNCREFVISAGGIKEAFPAVEQLVLAAPPLNRWQLISFRQRQAVECIIDFAGVSVDPAQVEFTLLTSKTEVGIYLYIPNYNSEDSRYRQIGYLFLDEALGEYDVETKLGLIEMFPTSDDAVNERHPLSELPAYFDDVYQRLHAQ